MVNSLLVPNYVKQPERFKQQLHSFPGDIWSLGITIAECAVGGFPFNQFQLLSNETIDFSALEKQFSHDFVQFIKDCMQRDPALRPTAAKLLTYPFIIMKKKVNVRRWLFDNIIAKVKAKK